MSTGTLIEWTDATWNPTRGCSRVSPGCVNCYAERQAIRHAGPGGAYAGLVRSTPEGPRWTGAARLVGGQLDAPLRWRKPRRIFVDSMSDLFHESLSDTDIAQVFSIMNMAERHTFQVLTKRPERIAWFASRCLDSAACQARRSAFDIALDRLDGKPITPWPLPNVWLGASVEDQARADERVPHLLAAPAAIRFLSVEPLLGPVRLSHYLRPFAPSIDWVILGGESGPGARRCDLAWIRSLVMECRKSGTPVFVKQLGSAPYGEWGDDTYPRCSVTYAGSAPVTVANVYKNGRWRLASKKGGAMSEWPLDLRVREFP